MKHRLFLIPILEQGFVPVKVDINAILTIMKITVEVKFVQDGQAFEHQK